MKTFTFTIVNNYGKRGTLTVKELSQKSATREANRKAKRLGFVLIF
jgi:hypothetical protein